MRGAWSWEVIRFLAILSKVFLIKGQDCPAPSFAGASYSVVDQAPTGVVFRVTISPSTVANSGWSVVVLFSRPLNADLTLRSYATQQPVIGPSRKVVTLRNLDRNQDLSKLQQFSFTFFIESTVTDLTTVETSFQAIVGFYHSPIDDGSCLIQPNPIKPLPATTSPPVTQSTSSTAPSTTMTVVTSSTSSPPITTSTSSTTTPCTGVVIPDGTTAAAYSLSNPGWQAGDGWNFIFKYEVPQGSYNDWTMKVVFSEEVTEISPFESRANGPHAGGLVWLLTPESWNGNVDNQELSGTAIAVTTGSSAPSATIILYNNGAQPDTSVASGPSGNCASSTTSTTTTTTTTTTTISSTSSPPTSTVASTVGPTLNPNGPTGSLPASSKQTVPQFIPSPDVDGDNPYDYNEILHKSLLFYEAQRSGKLPENNRIPWRGDSGLKDGCVGGVCHVDLTGGWYDAGDFVKFGFPMAWTTTVLAWGMIEFKLAYEDAGEWDNAVDNLKWATDYLLKAHISPNELYFQVGDPNVDHSYWGHPETMKMERPIYKVDTNNPGTEVAAETAAAFAASSIVFENSDSTYSTNLLNHAIQLYHFADNYRGNYHESVPESKVSNFYRSWSGYKDELMWSAMWLYKATNDQKYLNDAIKLVNSVGVGEFSWDSKGPGALVLLSQERSTYKTKLLAAINNVMAKDKTPKGLTYFSEWGTNRYAANYGFIALLTAKMEGETSRTGQTYHDYAKDQISKMLGSGDNSRSYVVGFGVKPPKRPHHRSSSCRRWTRLPARCNSKDRDAKRRNPLILYGALVGGPGKDGSYVDDRGDYKKNEVAIDYNAGFQSAIAGLKFFQIMARS